MTMPAELPPPTATARWTGARIAGWALMGFWVLCGIAIIAYFVAGYDAEFVAR